MKAAKFSNAVIIGAAAYCGLILVFAATKGVSLYYLSFWAVLLCLIVISLRLQATYRVNIALLLVSTGLSLLVAGAVLEFIEDTPNRHLAAARRANSPFDSRTLLQVVKDLRNAGEDAYPLTMAPIGGVGVKGLEIDGEEVFHLGGIANSTTVYCDEIGK